MASTYTVVGSLRDVTIYDDGIVFFMSEDTVWPPEGQVFDDQNRITDRIKLWSNKGFRDSVIKR